MVPIPRWLLPDACTVREPLADGTLGTTREVRGVRFERAQTACTEAHRTADAGSGVLWVDAVRSEGAFEVPAGSRIGLGGRSYLAARVSRFEGPDGRVHHWEIELR